jgi:hypothetical protein
MSTLPLSRFGIWYPRQSLPSNHIGKLAKNSWYYKRFYPIWTWFADDSSRCQSYHRIDSVSIIDANPTIKLVRHWVPDAIHTIKSNHCQPWQWAGSTYPMPSLPSNCIIIVCHWSPNIPGLIGFLKLNDERVQFLK